MIPYFLIIFLLVFGACVGLARTNVRKNKIMATAMLGFSAYTLSSLLSSALSAVSLIILIPSVILLMISFLPKRS